MEIIVLFILLIIAFFAWSALRGWVRGTVQVHDSRARDAIEATKDSLAAGHDENPSWANDPNKMHEFTYGIRKLIDRAGVSEEVRKTLFAEEMVQKIIMTHAAHMERKGASFIQQQLGASELATQMAQRFERKKANGNPTDFAAMAQAFERQKANRNPFDAGPQQIARTASGSRQRKPRHMKEFFVRIGRVCWWASLAISAVIALFGGASLVTTASVGYGKFRWKNFDWDWDRFEWFNLLEMLVIIAAALLIGRALRYILASE